MKSRKIAGFLLCILFLFSGCTASSPASDSSQTASDTDAQAPSLPLTMTVKYNSSGTPNDKGYYYIEYRKDGSQNIKYIDYATMQTVYLCNRPACKHEDDTCTSWVPFTGGTVSPVPIGEKLYLIFYPGEPVYYQTYGDIALPHIDAMDLNGANRKTVAVLDSEMSLSGHVATDGLAIYMLAARAVPQGDEVYMKQELTRIDLSTGQTTLLATMPDSFCSLIGTLGANLVIEINHMSDSGRENNTTALYTVPAIGGELKEVTEYKTLTGSSFYWNDILYYVDAQTSSITKTNLATGEETVAVHSYANGAVERPYLWYVADDKAVIMESVQDKEMGPMSVVKSVNLQTGAATKITLGYTDAGKDVLIEPIAETDEYLLVIAGREYLNIEMEDPGIYTALGMPSPQYAFISMDDFFANRPNYIYPPLAN